MATTTSITDANLRGLLRLYFAQPSNLPEDLRDKVLNDWDVSQVTNMDSLFKYRTFFNEPLGNWNVSQVTNMAFMFEDCEKFNQSLENWNVRNVRDVQFMFAGCSNLNQSFVRWELDASVFAVGMFVQCPQMREENKPRLPFIPTFTPLFTPVFTPKTMGEKILEMCDGIVPVPVPVSTGNSGKTIPADAKGWDVVGDEEVVIRDFLKKDAKNIVFLSNSQYYPMNKDTLRNTILTDGSNIKYACSQIGGTAVLDVPYLNMKSVGLVVAFLVNIAEIMFVLKEPAIQAMELVSSGRTLDTTISYDYLYGTDNQRAYGASHCQEGQGGTIANLQETEVGVEAIGKERGGVGGKRRRNSKKTRRNGKKTKRKGKKARRNRTRRRTC